MHLIGPVVLGIGIVVLLGALVAVKQISTGSVLDKPHGNFLIQFVNGFNLFFLLIVNPLAAIGLLAGWLPRMDPTHLPMGAWWLLVVVEIAGLLLYVAGFALMGWALLALGRFYQLGGSVPRSQDRMVEAGPYAFIRHPMYAAALSISLGLALLLQSLAFAAVFIMYLVLILGLTPLEERALEKAYSAHYVEYRRRTRMLIPAIY